MRGVSWSEAGHWSGVSARSCGPAPCRLCAAGAVMSSSVRRSIAFSVVERYASIAIGLVTTIILSRLLTPTDFGIFSIAMSFVMFADIFRDFGTGNYLLQARQAHRPASSVGLHRRARYLGAVRARAAPGNAGHRLALRRCAFWQLMPLFALNMMLGPFSVTGICLLRRNLAFGTWRASACWGPR